MSLLGIIASSRISFSPASLPNLKAWYDAADTSSITGGSQVSQWNDLSGNGFHLTQSTSSKRPSSGTRTLNSKNVIDFDGTNDILQASTASDWTFMNNSGGCTVFFVYMYDDNTAASAWCTTDNASGAEIGFDLFDNAELAHRVNRGVGGQNAVSNETLQNPSQGNHYLYVLSDPNNATAANRSEIYVDGVLQNKNNTKTDSPSASAPLNPLDVGGRRVDDGYAFDGAFAEIIIVSGLMSAENITKTKSYISTKWGV
jgi:hypothetical protein